MRNITLLTGSIALVSSVVLGGCASDPAAPDPGIEGANGIGGADAGADANSDSASADSEAGGSFSYPAGPYGNTVKSTLKDFSFEGLVNPKAVNYVADATTLTTISMHDFYNPTCDPSKPRALLVTASALWCSACKAEAETTMANYKYWHPKGVEFVTTVFEDENSEPSQFPDLTTWAKAYSLEYPTVLDPNLKLGAFFNKSASPFNMIIDTCTMQIKVAMEGALDTGPGNTNFSDLVK